MPSEGLLKHGTLSFYGYSKNLLYFKGIIITLTYNKTGRIDELRKI